MKHEIGRDDIMALDDYVKIRRDRRKALIAIKETRRLHIGPHATAHFENYDTIWQQIHEMLYIEKGGEDQLPGELAAYNPLIPKGRELVATIMFEIEDEVRRHRLLAGLGGVEHCMSLAFAGHVIKGEPEGDIERSDADGKASSVQFLHFPFTDDQAAAFKTVGGEILVSIDHPNYRHMTILPEATRAALAEDLD
jgi:hypothetical protein